MPPKYFYGTTIFSTIFIVTLVLLAACSVPPRTVAEIDAPPDAQDTPADHVAVQVDTGSTIPATKEPVATQEMSLQDGSLLLQSRCSACHLIPWLEQFKKTGSEWEEILARMEAKGVKLSETEKGALVDFLAVIDQP